VINHFLKLNKLFVITPIRRDYNAFIHKNYETNHILIKHRLGFLDITEAEFYSTRGCEAPFFRTNRSNILGSMGQMNPTTFHKHKNLDSLIT
jgi:hypothetical protein